MKALNSLRRQPEALALIRELDLVLPEVYDEYKRACNLLRVELEEAFVSSQLESDLLHWERFDHFSLYRESFGRYLAERFPNLRPYSPPICRYVGVLRYLPCDDGVVRPHIFRQVDLFSIKETILEPSDIS